MKKIIASLSLAAVLLLPVVASAQINLNKVPASTFGLNSSNLESTVVKIVQWVLGLLGLIAVILIIYGGFVWVTAGGNEDKVATAKRVISAAVVGLIIVLLAWAIVTFVVQTTTNVTQ